MATPDRDTAYNADPNRTVYTREKSGTGWFVGIIVVLALLAIGYLVFSANRGATVGETTTGAPAVESSAPASSTMTAPSVTAPAVEAPAAIPAPATTPAAPAATTP